VRAFRRVDARDCGAELRETASQPECVLGVRPSTFDERYLAARLRLRGRVLGTTRSVTWRRRGFVKARLTRRRRFGSASQWGSRSPENCRSSIADPAAFCARRCRWRRAWLTSGSRRSCKTSTRPKRWRELSLEIGDGEFVVLLGSDRSGKTTTLRLVAGWKGPMRPRRPLPAETSPPRRRRCVTSLLSSSKYSLYRISPCSTTRLSLRSPVAVRTGRDQPQGARRSRAAAYRGQAAKPATRSPAARCNALRFGRALIRSPRLSHGEPLSSLDAKLRGRCASSWQRHPARARRDRFT